MKTIKDIETGGERPFFASNELKLENVVIHEGESALKECRDVVTEGCLFEGRYPFWHNDRFEIRNCRFTVDSRAPLWYSRNMLMADTVLESPKSLREMETIRLERVRVPDAVETLWHCKDVHIDDMEVVNGDYFLLHSDDIEIENLRLKGKYTFQYCRRVVVRNSVLDTKDAFWMTSDVLLENCLVKGEYLAWHSHNLRLVNCHITGTQPLCYAHNLVLENCTFGEDADLAFEYSSVEAQVNSRITSVKNPLTGSIRAEGYGEIILDENLKAPGDCRILLADGSSAI